MKTILLTGQTDLVTTQILEQISRRFSIVLTSQEKDREEDEGRVYHIHPGSTSFEQLFWAYDFSAVWYFSPYCDDGDGADALSELKIVCRQCRENSVKKLLVISSSFLSAKQMEAEENILFSMKKTGAQTVLLRAPWILADENQKNSLGRLFSDIYNRTKTVSLPDIADGNYEFLPMKDIVSLLKKMTLSAQAQGVYRLPGEYVISREQLRSEISQINRKCRLQTDGRSLKFCDYNTIDQLSKEYSYQVRDQKQLDFAKLYDEFAKNEKKKSRGIAAWMTKQRSKVPRQLVKLIDIVVLFFLAEYISQFTSDFVWFREIDVRVIYIFLIATFHGLQAGLISSLAECVMLFFEYRMLGVYGLQLFYNVENWIPFVLCIVTGAVTGYFSDLRENERKLVDSENALLREKYLFLNDMYNVSSEIKDEYRRQILTFDNSYGKIYDAIERMNCGTVSEVCVKAQRILEQFLENSTIEVYRWVSAKGRAERVAVSHRPSESGRDILLPEGMREVFSDIESGKVFRNIQLISELPMYAMGVKPGIDGHEEISYEPVIVVIWEAPPEQMNDYYSNQFEILCGLMGDALNRAALMEHIAEAVE